MGRRTPRPHHAPHEVETWEGSFQQSQATAAECQSWEPGSHHVLLPVGITKRRRNHLLLRNTSAVMPDCPSSLLLRRVPSMASHTWEEEELRREQQQEAPEPARP